MNTPSKPKNPLLWLGGAVVAVFLPKCLACVAGYVALVLGVAATAPEICGAAPSSPPAAADLMHEKIIKAYFAGWERKDWSAVAGQLAEAFTFTSPAPDDHLPVDKFKAKCWNQTEFIQRFEFPGIVWEGNSAFAIVHVFTNDGRVIRNTEYFTFENGKIKSIEVFFGGNGRGYPSNK